MSLILESMYTIYMLDWSHLGGLKYVGCTQNLVTRLRNHRNHKEVRLPTAAWITYGKPEIKILDIVETKQQAKEIENQWIIRENTDQPYGYNLIVNRKIIQKKNIAKLVGWA